MSAENQDTEVLYSETVQVPEAEATTVSLPADPTVPAQTTILAKLPPEPKAESTDNQWQQLGQRLAWLTSEVPDQLTAFLDRYQTPVKGLSILALSIPFVVFVAALLKVIDVVPLLAPSLELIGFGYSAWFVWRYLLFASSRKDLSKDFDKLKTQIWGSDSEAEL